MVTVEGSRTCWDLAWKMAGTFPKEASRIAEAERIRDLEAIANVEEQDQAAHKKN